MKPRITKKDWKDSVVIGVWYCDIQYLTNYLSPIGYTEGVYGWNSDFYSVLGDIYVSTGYRPSRTIKLSAEQVKEINSAEQLATEIVCSTQIDYDTKQIRVNNLFKNLFLDIYHENKNK